MGLTIKAGKHPDGAVAHFGYGKFARMREWGLRLMGGFYKPGFFDPPPPDGEYEWYCGHDWEPEKYPGLTLFFSGPDDKREFTPLEVSQLARDFQQVLLPRINRVGDACVEGSQQRELQSSFREYWIVLNEANYNREPLLYG